MWETHTWISHPHGSHIHIHTDPMSLLPLSKKARCLIHYHRIRGKFFFLVISSYNNIELYFLFLSNEHLTSHLLQHWIIFAVSFKLTFNFRLSPTLNYISYFIPIHISLHFVFMRSGQSQEMSLDCLHQSRMPYPLNYCTPKNLWQMNSLNIL